MAYRNDTKGARAIHLTNGTHLLVEPGAVAVVSAGRVRRLAPGLIEVDDPELPPVPDDLKEAVTTGARPKAKKAAPPKPATATRKRTARKPARKR